MSAPSRARPVEDRHRLVGATIDSRIRIDSVVARGGFGLVYKGEHLGLHVPVAVKVLHVPEQYSDAVKVEFRHRFVQEARLVYELSHPAIVRLLDHGVTEMPTGEVVPWMVLEWLEGATLGRALEQRAGVPFAPREALARLRPVIEALAMVHARGVAHRDVTPANIFLCDTPSGLMARLIDFGVARVMEMPEGPGSGQTSTQSSITAFSKAYAAPEQLGHTRTGPWTDVHALALVLSEMMTLRSPYEGSDAAERLMVAMSQPRPTPGSKGVDVGAFEAVLARALALRPGERYANAGELLAALDEADRAPMRRSTTPSNTRAWWLGGALLVGMLAGIVLARSSRAHHVAPVPIVREAPAPSAVRDAGTSHESAPPARALSVPVAAPPSIVAEPVRARPGPRVHHDRPAPSSPWMPNPFANGAPR